MTPNPTAHGPPEAGDGGYRINIEPPMVETEEGFTYNPGQSYTVTLVGTTETFKGFLVQARAPSSPPPSPPILLGSFTVGSSDQQLLDCDAMGVATEAAIGHSSADTRSSVEFTWKAPATDGIVDFFYTVVRVKKTHFDRLSARKLKYTPSTISLSEGPPGNASHSVKAPEDYRIHFYFPDGCNRTECISYVAIDTNTGNDSYLDIYMEGRAAGWVGVGFSETASMFSADVVVCNRLNEQMVCLDSWNNAKNPRGCPTDVIQDVYLFEGNYTDGRLSCRGIKRILPSDEYDIDLDQDLYVLYGHRTSNASTLMAINAHDFGDNLPRISAKKMNVVKDGGSSDGGDFEVIRERLIRAHGILMIIAWPMFAVTAIFFPIFMKPALPNGQWFQIHRSLMFGSVFLAAVGFVLIFVAQINQSIPGLIPLGSSEPIRTTHFAFGIIVMLFHLINPILGFLRCKPDSKKRWIFNLLHGRVIGLFTLMFALVNIGLGLWLVNSIPFWVYISWDVVYIFTIIVLFNVFTFVASSSSPRECESLAPSTIQWLFKIPSSSNTHHDNITTEWSSKDGVTIHEHSDEDETVPLVARSGEVKSKDYVLRVASLAIFLVFSLPLLFLVMVLTGLYSINKDI